MANIDIDTAKIRDAGNNINKAVADYNASIDQIFNLVNKVEADGVWTGKRAKEYRNVILPEKKIYNSFGRNLKSLGDKLLAAADNYDGEIRRQSNTGL